MRDAGRNQAYLKWFEHISHSVTPPQPSSLFAIDIGTGPTAFLSKLLVTNSPNVIVQAFEIVERFVESARDHIQEQLLADRIEVIAGLAQDGRLDHLHPPHLVFHEILGGFASDEGVAATLSEFVSNNSQLFDESWSLWGPFSFATFYEPFLVDVDVMGARPTKSPWEIIFAADQPRLAFFSRQILHTCARANKARNSSSTAICRRPKSACGVLERFDMTQHKVKTMTNVQNREFLFHFDKDQDLNCLALFIWLGFTSSADQQQSQEHHEHDEHLVSECISRSSCVGSPWDDHEIAASNWSNPVVFLRERVHVTTQDTMLVRTCVRNLDTLPTYEFEVEIYRGESLVFTDSMSVSRGVKQDERDWFKIFEEAGLLH
jgi:hypothetical protein